jgi:hypothetical protein
MQQSRVWLAGLPDCTTSEKAGADMQPKNRLSELGPLLAAVYDKLAEVEKLMHEMKVMSTALRDTLDNIHPDAQAVYEMAYQHHSQATAELHLKAITELKGIADSLRSGW